jgi:hypothetical protein
MKKLGNPRKIRVEKIEIFEDEKYTTGGEDTHDQPGLPFSPFRSFDQKTRGIVDRNGQGENQNIDRYEGHIENTTCHQKKEPAILMGNQEIENGDRGKKDQKRE